MSYSSIGKWTDGLGETDNKPEGRSESGIETSTRAGTHLAPESIETLGALGAEMCSFVEWMSGRMGWAP